MITRLLFVCHGNICRSPMAEFVMKQLVAVRGRAAEFEIASAATSTEEIGSDVYLPAQACLRAHNVPFTRRAARQVTPADYRHYDRIFVMDSNNLRNIRYVLGEDSEHKISRLIPSRDIADPWYTDDFETTYADIVEGCSKLLG